MTVVIRVENSPRQLQHALDSPWIPTSKRHHRLSPNHPLPVDQEPYHGLRLNASLDRQLDSTVCKVHQAPDTSPSFAETWRSRSPFHLSPSPSPSRPSRPFAAQIIGMWKEPSAIGCTRVLSRLNHPPSSVIHPKTSLLYIQKLRWLA